MGKPLVALSAILALTFTAAAFATDAPPAASKAGAGAPTIHWQHKLSDVVVTKTDADGQTIQQLDVNVLDYFLGTISGYSESSASQTNGPRRDDVVDKLSRLAIMLRSLDKGTEVDINILQREALAYSLLYDLGFDSVSDKTDVLYQRLLKQTPDDPAANYLYGDFLAHSDARRPESIAYLDKALKLGVKKANYSLGVVYVTEGKNPQALACLKQYSADYPNDQRAKRLIAAVQNGDVRREYRASPAAGTH